MADPGPNDVLVRIRASSLNYHDYAVVAGILPVAAEAFRYQISGGHIGKICISIWISRVR